MVGFSIPALPLYARVSVPLYHYPDYGWVEKLRREILSHFGSLKAGKDIVRREYRCFFSENFIWKKIFIIEDIGEEVPPNPPVLSLLVIMCRGALPADKVDYGSIIRSMGLKPNPYVGSRDEPCVGFYAKSFDEAVKAVDRLGREGVIRDAMIVNGVWHMTLPSRINIAVLAKQGIFIPSTRGFDSATAYIDGAAVTVFRRGKVRIAKATTQETAERIARKTYYLLLTSRSLLD